MEPRADTPWNKFRKQVLRLLDEPDSSLAAYVFKYAMLFTIITAVTLMLLNTLPRYGEGRDYHEDYNDAFVAWELVFNIIFLVEFIVRVAVGENLATDVFLYFDFIAVLPFMLEKVGYKNSPPVLKAVRVVRLLKIARQYDASIIIVRTIKVSLAALLVPFFFLMVAVIVFASFLFYLELKAGESEDGGGHAAFQSIPHAIWFMLVTMTTVGYGDVSPNTGEGKMVTVFAMVFGVLFLSMPLAIVGNNFCEIWDDRARVIFLEKFKDQYLRRTGVTRQGLEQAFDEIDVDKGGTLTRDELCISLETMHVRLPKAEISELWRALDWDGSGEISKQEFLDLIAEAEGVSTGDDALNEEVMRARRRTENLERMTSRGADDAPSRDSFGSLDDTPGSPGSVPSAGSPVHSRAPKSPVAAGASPSAFEVAQLRRLVQGVSALRSRQAETAETQKALELNFESARQARAR